MGENLIPLPEFSSSSPTTWTDTIAIEWEGLGSATIDSSWAVNFPGVPNLVLSCTVNGTLPAGGTVRWTLNPDGSGFQTKTGETLPTTTGTFTVPGGPADLEVTPTPPVGGFLDPAVDPIEFEFNADMATPIAIQWQNLGEAQISCDWATPRRLACDVMGTLPDGNMVSWVLNPPGNQTMQSVDERVLPLTAGTFTVQSGAPPTVSSIPEDGGSFDPDQDIILFNFSKPMDLTIDIDWQGTGLAVMDCFWAGDDVLQCDVMGDLPQGGTVTWTLNPGDSQIMQSLDGQPLETASGSFTVNGGSGSGDPCPALPGESRTGFASQGNSDFVATCSPPGIPPLSSGITPDRVSSWMGAARALRDM